MSRALTSVLCSNYMLKAHSFATLTATRNEQDFAKIFAKKSKANGRIERARRNSAEEEQELLDYAPTTNMQECKVEDHATVTTHVHKLGVVLLPMVMDSNIASSLKSHVDDLLDISKSKVVDSKQKYLDLFGPVMTRTNRYDLLLPLDDVVLPAVQSVLSSVAPTILELLGNEAYLCELTALISDAGAKAQVRRVFIDSVVCSSSV